VWLQNIEIGKSFNIVDLGIAYGRNSLRPDTTSFLEARVTMDVCNMGIFANEMTIGAGKLFDSQGSLMLELTYSIFAQISSKWGIGLVTGYYDFSNEYYDSSKSFYGFLIRYGLQRTDSGGIFGLGRGHGRPKTRQKSWTWKIKHESSRIFRIGIILHNFRSCLNFSENIFY
jgi:hypothetical protein